MVEADKDDCWPPAPAPLLSAVETILREIGEEPEREVCDSMKLHSGVGLCLGLQGCGHRTFFKVFTLAVPLMLLHRTFSPALVVSLYGGLPLQGLRGSAERYVNFLLASTAGYQLLPDTPWPLPVVRLQPDGGPSPPCSSCSGMQELHLHFLSQCEHHMLPFHGLVHVAYLPGPSGRRLNEAGALALLKAFSRRLQIQERLTQQLADALHHHAGLPRITPVTCALALQSKEVDVCVNISAVAMLALCGSVCNATVGKGDLMQS